MHKFPGAK